MSSPSNINSRISGDDLRKTQLDRFEILHSQNLEDGYFDVVFEIEGKKLHAHKFILTTVSETMAAMVSARWSSKDKPIKIETYSYDIFYELIRFLYTGSCRITIRTVFLLVDIAEFYGVSLLKNLCEKYLCESHNFCTPENVEKMYEFSQKYSMKKMEYYIFDYIRNRLTTITEGESFLSFKKSFVEILAAHFYQPYKVKFFEAVYKWAELEVKKQLPVDDKHFDLREAIKTEFCSIIPLPNFDKMPFEFLMDFVVDKGFILSPADFNGLRMLNSFIGKERLFKQLYELAEKQALKKQKMSSDPDKFDLDGSIKADMVEVIRNIEFYDMSKEFLMDFVVSNELITEEQANHVYDTRVCITNNGKSVSGIFKDEINLRIAYEERKYLFTIRRRSPVRIRFIQKHFSLPSTPSTVTKMKGVQWYLCLDKDGTLAFKHYSIIVQSDYLLAEMKGDTDFKLTPDEKTTLSAELNNIYL